MYNMNNNECSMYSKIHVKTVGSRAYDFAVDGAEIFNHKEQESSRFLPLNGYYQME